ncbi:unnamed protein product [Paramecium pentaurelia]|uniref:Transmembrane protein n=1 Tax=Paramecium pentaurelia TaxID=43138 RepID=A0A8S1XQA1_9CILI|nr:unnamed protein product [Paramecium pentaurelia]
MFLGLLCITYSVLANQPIQIGETVNNAIMPWHGNAKYELYQFELKEVKQDSDLVVVVKQLSALGNPDIYISTKVTEPNENTADQICDSIGMDICVIDKPQKGPYYLAIHCDGYCRYSLKVVYQSELLMTNSDDLEFKYDKTTWTDVIRIETKNLTWEETQLKPTLEIQVRVKNMEILQESFKSYLNIGESKPTPQHSDFIGQDTFSGMQKFKIHNLETNSKFTLLVEGQEGAIIQVQTRTYLTIRYLELGDRVEDIVAEDDYQFYCIDLSQDYESIQLGQTVLNIQLLPYKGYTEMYVNLDFQPPFLDQYYWQLKDRITDDLVISKADLDNLKAKGNYVFVAVRGKESNATYELKSQIVDPNFMLLELNKPTTAKLSKNSQIAYKFYIRYTEKQSVSVSLKNIQGDADIIVKQCENLWNCNVQQDEIVNKEQKVVTEPGKLFLYSDNPGNDVIVFDNDPKICSQYDNTFQCYYDVLIYPGSKNDVDELIYSILITTKGESIILRENTPMKQYVGLGLNNYYKFIVEEQDYIRRLMIQVTPIQGQPKIFASKTNKNPTQKDQQAVQNVITYGQFGQQNEQEPISGTYYIAVNGYTACQYIITVYVFRNRGDWSQIGKYPHQYILLLDGYPQEITSQNNSDVQLFKIDLSAYYNPDQQIHYGVDVKLRVIQGSFLMYGFDHPEVDKNKAFLTGSDFLSINPRSKIYPQYLYIRVEPNPVISTNQLSYQIYYRINNQPIELIIGDNYRGYISQDETQTFLLNYFTRDELVITKNVEYMDQSVLKAQIYYGNLVQEMKASSMLLRSEDLNFEKCKTNATEIIKCQITIMITATVDTYFSLLVTKEASIVFLYDGEPVTKPLQNKADHYLFYLTDQETEISVFSISGELKILLQLFNSQPKLEEFPTNNQDSILQSLDDSNDIGSSIFISDEFLEINNCKQNGCYMAVTCIKDSKYDPKGQYVITRSSSYTILYPSIIYYGEAENQKIKYFKIFNVSLASGLMVVVSPLSSGSLIVLASRNEMPTLDTHQFSSNTMLGDQLIIPPKENSLDAVNYYVGVYAFDNVKFSIQINIGNLHFYQIKKGIPMNFFAEYNSVTYLNYYHAQDSEFTILFSSNLVTQYNRANVHVYTYKDMTMQADAILKVKDEPMWKMIDFFLTIKKDIKYCSSCYYLISVENFNVDNDISITISLDNESTQLLDNVEITNHISSNQPHYYHYVVEDDFYLNTTIYDGDIKIFGGYFKTLQDIDNLLLTLDVNEGLTDKDGKVIGYSYAEGQFPNKTIEINKDNSGEHKYLYRFKIISKSRATYKIECIQKQQAIELKLGEPQSHLLNSTHTVPFYFVIPDRSYENSNEGFYTLDIETYGHSQSRISEKTQHPNIKLTQDLYNNPNFLSDYHNLQDVQFIRHNQTDQIMHFEFPSTPGLYFLQISPREPSNLPYTVTLGNDFLNVLAPKLQRFASNKIGQQRFWEINLHQPSKILIQAQLCGGIISVYGSENLENLQRGSYSQKMDYKHNKQIIGTIPIQNAGPYYLSTKAIKSIIPQKDYVDYILKVNILQPSSIVPHEHFEPGDGGEFTAHYDGENISVFFSPIQVTEKSSSEYKIQSFSYNFIYKLYNQTDEEIPIYHCDSSISFPSISLNREPHQQKQELSHQFYVGKNFEKISLSILAKVRINTNNFEEIRLYYYYDTLTMKVDNIILRSNPKVYRRGIIFGIITVLLLAILYLYIRNRRLKQIIKFESSEQGIQQLVRQEQSIEMNYANLR